MLSKDQLENRLTLDNFVEFWLGLSKEELAVDLGEACAKMYAFDQRNPHHCYTLLEHCVRTADNIKIKSKEDFLLKTAALFHDIGKPFVAKEKQGRLVFYGHAQKSAQIMEAVLPKFGFTREECFYILFLIKHHDDFISYTDLKEDSAISGKVLITKASVAKYLDKLKHKNKELPNAVLNTLLEKLFLLCIADVSSQSEFAYFNGVLKDTRKDKIRRINLIREYMRCILREEHF